MAHKKIRSLKNISFAIFTFGLLLIFGSEAEAADCKQACKVGYRSCVAACPQVVMDFETEKQLTTTNARSQCEAACRTGRSRCKSACGLAERRAPLRARSLRH